METSAVLSVLYTALLNSWLKNGPSTTAGGGVQVNDNLVVKTAYGDIRGIQTVLDNGASIRQFNGIPFARPPIGTRRFKRPESPLPWEGIRDGSRYGQVCTQQPGGILLNNTGMGEDCLYLNVYSPKVQINVLLPVMVWIHGGAYYLGSGSDYNGTLIAAKGVIMVTINYRLGVFGFMSTEDDVVPGNFGMLDQILALKWIKENIQAFGGDPGTVTIFGQSAGGHSVALLSLSPLARNLFQRAIVESGTSMSPTSLTWPTDRVSPKQMSQYLSSKLGCPQQDSILLLSCLQTRSTEAILNASINLKTYFNLRLAFKPRVEKSFGFLPEYPKFILERGDFANIDTLRGFSANESLVLVNDTENNGLSLEEFKEQMKNMLASFSFAPSDELVQTLIDTFLQNTTNSFVRRSQLGMIYSDFIFASPTIQEIDIYSKFPLTSSTQLTAAKKHFLYIFSYRGSFSTKYPQWSGVLHGAEVPFVFGLANDISLFFAKDSPISVSDRQIGERVITMWTDFAKYGNPTQTTKDIQWLPYSDVNQVFLDIASVAQVSRVDRQQADQIFNILNKRLLGSQDGSSAVIG